MPKISYWDRESGNTTNGTRSPASPTASSEPTVIEAPNTSASTEITEVAHDVAELLFDMIPTISGGLSLLPAQIVSKVDDNHYDIKIVGDVDDTVIHNVSAIGQTNYKPGDNIYFLADPHNLSTGLIQTLVRPVETSTVNTAAFGQDNAFRSDPQGCYLRFYAGKWTLVLSKQFYLENLFPYMTQITDPVTQTETMGVNVRIGVSRVLSQKSSAGRAHWAERRSMPSGRYKYSYPEYFDVRMNGVTNGLRCAQTEIITELDCTSNGTLTIDVTDIVNNSIFKDLYVLNRSHRSNIDHNPIQKAYDANGYWFKRFGIYIKLQGKTGTGQMIYVTPLQSTYTVRVFVSPYSTDVSRLGLQNLSVQTNNIIELRPGVSGAPYVPPPGSIVPGTQPPAGDNNFLVNDGGRFIALPSDPVKVPEW